MPDSSTSSHRSNPRDAEFLRQLADKAGINGWVRNALNSLTLRPNPALEKAVRQFLMMQPQILPLLINPFTLPVRQSELPGEIALGHVIGEPGTAFRVLKKNLLMHILIAGTSGSGKTSLAMQLAEKTHLSGFGPIKVFDPKIDEFLQLAKKHPDFIAYHWRELRLNPFQAPPNVPVDEWLQVIVGHMSQCFNFWEGAESLILVVASSMIRTQGYTSAGLVLKRLESNRGDRSAKGTGVRDTAMSRFELMLMSLGEVFCIDNCMLEVLSERNFVLSTAGLMSEMESWLDEFLLIWEFMYRAHNPDKQRPALYIYDECQHRLFNAEKERNIKKISSAIISKLVDEARALQLGICSLSQEPSTLIKGVLNNSFTKICLHLGSGAEIRMMSEAMGLNDSQADVLHYLETGQAIIRMAGGYMDALPVALTEFVKPVGVDEDEFWHHQATLKAEVRRLSGLREEELRRQGATLPPKAPPPSSGGAEDYDKLG